MAPTSARSSSRLRTSLRRPRRRRQRRRLARRRNAGRRRSTVRLTPPRRSARRTRGSSRELAPQLGAVVELLDDDTTRRSGLDAEVAEDALVEVLADDLHLAAVVGIDVDRADLLELRGQLRVAGDLVRDHDVDEDSLELVGHQTFAPSFSLTAPGISSIRSTTGIPASSRRAIFCVAESSAPSTIVPAWPKLMPCISSSSMNLPAMKAMIGSLASFSSRQSTSSASMRPPGSV